ncbi:5-(carboxyamino)imidazole ribonucleotide synthase [Cyanobium sp. ATX 6A2]|uniref:5-(carboxyamino)imidazole ribonucleotide synthase n=1 Tax=Cyanobium sp. ATX 6A2 TaxID=2823700 RepID=UPI0020CB954C|nr:5-(carboxyamino)imidazole ribonucleotide synthase [Cyanobium sp. ATX 6A2]MCP9887315.1 5-(carboxyamino)imidazole ribonucleotide synthase [Cyanobium sp. ATX 6A2]
MVQPRPATPHVSAAERRPPIGVVGGGQLAWMLAAAARELALPLLVQTPDPDDPATRLATDVIRAAVRDVEGTRRLAQRCSAITFENEWVDLAGLASLAVDGVSFVPSLTALEPLVCKRSQRELLRRLNLPSPPWLPLSELLLPGEGDDHHRRVGDLAHAQGSPAASAAAPPAATNTLPGLRPGWQFPLMAKAVSGGYDGKGTALLRDRGDLDALLERVDPEQWIVETVVEFDQELSQLVCRDRDGRVLCYPLVRTHQHQRVCDWVLAPAPVSHAVQAYARNIATSLLTALDYVGVLSIEFFSGPCGLQVNEIAPRTHNSGHVTIEAAHTSQFAQQARIVAGLPMGPVEFKVPGALMVNLLGFEHRQADAHSDDAYRAEREALAALPGAALHWYGKRGARPGRKLGHITLLLEGPGPAALEQQARARLQAVRALWPLPSL